MTKEAPIAVLGTFDSKGEEHQFLKTRIQERGIGAITINVGTKRPSSYAIDMDLYREMAEEKNGLSRDQIIREVILRGRTLIRRLYENNEISGVISAGGGTGTYISTTIMHVLPLGVPKVMVSTVASRDMSETVGVKDITMMHSVSDILGINTITGTILDNAAGAICGMVKNRWETSSKKKRVALSFFGFITPAAENVKRNLETLGYEVVPFHANGTGGMAMMELAGEGYFHGIFDLATHELADKLMDGYCGAIGEERFEPVHGREIPRLIVPGGMDCIVLEFTRDDIPPQFKDRKIFFYDFRSAIRVNADESRLLAGQLSEKLNMDPENVRVMIPLKGLSVADQEDGPLYDPATAQVFVDAFKKGLTPGITVETSDLHINDPSFAERACSVMDDMIQRSGTD
ncbi:MAG: Tm-1-like ATP-binding domain-containing protein [Deltaproteobacteria bacterium]|nr:Tm-1-like ATP-binding domain-containing protein [Deltaproteobacteria bacterium]